MTRAELLRHATVGGAALAAAPGWLAGTALGAPRTATSAPSSTTASSRAASPRSRAPRICWRRARGVSCGRDGDRRAARRGARGARHGRHGAPRGPRRIGHRRNRLRRRRLAAVRGRADLAARLREWSPAVSRRRRARVGHPADARGAAHPGEPGRAEPRADPGELAHVPVEPARGARSPRDARAAQRCTGRRRRRRLGVHRRRPDRAAHRAPDRLRRVVHEADVAAATGGWTRRPSRSTRARTAGSTRSSVTRVSSPA